MVQATGSTGASVSPATRPQCDGSISCGDNADGYSMAVDLGDLVLYLEAEVSPPGNDLFADTLDDEWIVRLANGFWNARLDGILEGYVEAEGEITPVSGDTDMPRDLQQVIVFYAAYETILLALRTLNTTFRAVAGPVEFETGQSAQVLRDIAQALKDKRNLLLSRLSDLGMTTDYVIDSIVARQDSLLAGVTTWVAH